MAKSLLLVHSPLVGPSTWSTFADMAAAEGNEVAAPDLTGVAAAPSPRWQWFVDAAVREAERLDGPIIVVGHSGAGVMLPSIAAKLGDRCATSVFVDAIVPPASGAHRASTPFLEMIDRQTVNGWLNQWLTWWPEEVVAQLVPEPKQRATLLADMPRLPRSFYDEAVPVADDWSSGPNAYLQLSPAYDDDRSVGEQWGWPTATIDSTHLGMLTDPSLVLVALTELTDR